MKVFLKLQVCAEYSESNHQTLSLVEDFVNWTRQEEEFYKKQSHETVLNYLKNRYGKKFPKANLITATDFFDPKG
jgi:hypothetical protein